MSYVQQASAFCASLTKARKLNDNNPSPLSDHEMVSKLLQDKAKACPICTATHEMLCIGGEERFFASRYRVACVRCGHAGHYGLSIEGAVGNWSDESGPIAKFFRHLRSVIPGYKETMSLITPMHWY